MAAHSSPLAWQILWTEEPGGLQSMGSLGVGHDWATSLSLFTLMHWRRKWQPTPVFLPRESQGRGSLVGCHLWGRTESATTEATQQQQQQQQWLAHSTHKQKMRGNKKKGFRAVFHWEITHKPVLAWWLPEDQITIKSGRWNFRLFGKKKKLVALSAFHLFTCHAELYSWTLLFLRLIWKVLCVFHRSDAVSRMLKAWDCGFQQSKSACVTVTIIYFWLHWISVAFFFCTGFL